MRTAATAKSTARQTAKSKSISYGDLPAPTQSLLQKWLRDVHKLHLNIVYSYDHNKFAVGGYDEYHSRLLDKRPRIEGRYPYPYKCEFIKKNWIHKTYEEALEMGLQEALKLIDDK